MPSTIRRPSTSRWILSRAVTSSVGSSRTSSESRTIWSSIRQRCFVRLNTCTLIWLSTATWSQSMSWSTIRVIASWSILVSPSASSSKVPMAAWTRWKRILIAVHRITSHQKCYGVSGQALKQIYGRLVCSYVSWFQGKFSNLLFIITILVSSLIRKAPFHNEDPQKIYENVINCKPKYAPSVSGLVRSLLKTIFVGDPGFRATLAQIKKHPVFKRIDWKEAKTRQLEAPFVPDDSYTYHNCNDRAQIVSRGALPAKKNLAPFAVPFLKRTESGADIAEKQRAQQEEQS